VVSTYRNLRLYNCICCGRFELCLPVSEHSNKKVFYHRLAHSFNVSNRSLSHRYHLVRIKKKVCSAKIFFFLFLYSWHYITKCLFQLVSLSYIANSHPLWVLLHETWKYRNTKMKVHISIRLEFLTHKYSLSGKNRSIYKCTWKKNV